jgi:TPR repeat protein
MRTPAETASETTPARGSEVRRMSRECEAGEKRSCFLLAWAYEKGEAPSAAPGEIVVREMSRAAYYYGRACSLGDMVACNSLATQYLMGDGVLKNASEAVRFYSAACNGPLDTITKFSCTSLGDLYASGVGVRANFKLGLALLARGCAMGDDHGCKLHDAYGGTDLPCKVPPPEGALGFSFGSSKDDAKAACLAESGKWSASADGARDVYFCDLRLAALDHDGMAELTFVNGRLAAIHAGYDVSPQTAGKEFRRVGDLLIKVYGLPSLRVVEVKDACERRELSDCIKEKQAEFSLFWAFNGQHSVSLSLDSLSKVPLVLILSYDTPESLKAFRTHGL